MSRLSISISEWILIEPFGFEHLGYLPTMLDERDPRPAREQLDANYRHSGGWCPMDGFSLDGMTLRYPGDPPFEMIGCTRVRDEVVALFEHDMVAIVQPDGSFEVARMD